MKLSRGLRTTLREARPWAALALVGALVGSYADAAPREAEIRFAKPRHLATVLGSTEIVLRLDLPDGVAAERVELRVDGRALTTLTEPPWQATWDAGDGSRGHSLEAILFLSDGQQARAMVRTSPLKVNQIEAVDLVNLYLVVRDKRGNYVTDLTRDEFQIFENRKLQSVERFSTTHKPLNVAIVLDTSHSMKKGERLERAKKAALEFLDILSDQDEGLVLTFSDGVYVAQDWTADSKLLSAAIDGTVAAGGTALYDAVWRASKLLRGFDSRKVVVLLSDGKDEAANGFEPGSLHTLEESLDLALRCEVMIFPIGLGRNLDKEYARRWGELESQSNVDTEQSLQSILERLADETGGRAVISPGPEKLRKAFKDIAADLRNQYSLAYVSTDPRHDGKWRSIQVRTPGRPLDVITRKGYYSPRPEKADSSAARR